MLCVLFGQTMRRVALSFMKGSTATRLQTESLYAKECTVSAAAQFNSEKTESKERVCASVQLFDTVSFIVITEVRHCYQSKFLVL